MAANDYHVIMYQILLYLYDCLKKGIDPDNETIDVYRRLHAINKRCWNRVITDMDNEGYIKRAWVSIRDKAGVWEDVVRINKYTEITREGIEYLIDDHRMNEIRNKGVDAIPDLVSDFGEDIFE